ncbi:protein kinase 4-like [Condylostylus longicornis]|uniref:protein kinase 4-like n=1 Tax=Condylostylus longicornis TaxID=2530218 RepID=UPI00244DEEFB|nr:protein kinase 4-like [Condylostylus longicornis]
MSDPLPISEQPRCQEQQQQQSNPQQLQQRQHKINIITNPIANTSESCKNTPNIGRKHHHGIIQQEQLQYQLHHHFQHNNLIFKTGSHSAHNSPLPHRRLDKLEGCIRDKPSPLCGRRSHYPNDSDDCSSSVEPSPQLIRKATAIVNQNISRLVTSSTTITATTQSTTNNLNNSNCSSCNTLNSSQNLNRHLILKSPENHQQSQQQHHIHHQLYQNDVQDGPRRRVESDCTNCNRHSSNNSNINNCSIHSQQLQQQNLSGNYPGSNSTTPKVKRKDFFFTSSPAKSCIGEPGVFSSPIHQQQRIHNKENPVNNTGTQIFCASPAKSIIGEPGTFASPIRNLRGSTSPNPLSNDDATHQNQIENISSDEIVEQPQPDQTIVSGWLKFRDNKRWKIRWGVVTKLSPAAGMSLK